MLYLSTRNKTDSFTAFRAMHNDHTPDGGLYVPFRLTAFNEEELAQLKNMSFGEVVAKVLNLFASQQLTGWDIDFCIGRTPAKVESAGHKAVVAELWHNHDNKYLTTRNTLYSKLYSTSEEPSDWAKIAIDTAILFGVYALIPADEAFNIALREDELSFAIAAVYARALGLPIGHILLSCSEMSPIWELVRTGQINTGALKRREFAYNSFLERLIFDTYGFEDAQKYVDAYNRSETYTIEEEQIGKITDQLKAAVIGPDRAENVIQSVIRSNGYVMSVDAAGAFGGLQDYRSKGGESRLTLLISGEKPVN